MKKTIKILISITIMCLALVITMSSCQKTGKRVYFDFPASGGMIEIPIGAESDKDLDSIIGPSKTVFTEESAPQKIVIDTIFPGLHSDSPLYYKNSSNSYRSGIWRYYEYSTETGSAMCCFYPKHNKLRSFLEGTFEEALKKKYLNLSENELLSKEQCLKKAEEFLAVLYNNAESFKCYDDGESRHKLEGLDLDCMYYKYLFSWEVDGVEICDVRIEVRNDGVIDFVLNENCMEAYYYDKTTDLDFSAALKEADDAVNEKMKSFGEKYTAQFQKASLLLGTKNRLLLRAQYELYEDDSLGSAIYVYVVL